MQHAGGERAQGAATTETASGCGRRKNGATTYYAYSSVLGVALYELNLAGTINRVHVTAGGKEIAQVATDGGFYWLYSNHLGTPRKMTNGTGVTVYRGEFDPHGNTLLEWSVINNPNLNNNKFTGYERDNAAGLDFAQARHYSYGRGRFVQPDPAGIKAANLKRPESLNRYAYVENDSLNAVDVNGLNRSSCFMRINWTLWTLGNQSWITIDSYQSFCVDTGDDSSGGGDGSGQAQKSDNENDIRQEFREFLMDGISPECELALADYLPKIRSLAVGANLIDLDKFGHLPASSYLHPQWLQPNNPNESLAQAYDRLKPSPGAWTTWGANPVSGIYFRGSQVNFYSSQSQGMYLLLHEMTHYTSERTDEDLVLNIFKIKPKENETMSQALSRFFNSKCQDK